MKHDIAFGIGLITGPTIYCRDDLRNNCIYKRNIMKSYIYIVTLDAHSMYATLWLYRD